MKVTKKMENDETREFWEFVEKTAKEVNTWPIWMRGGEPKNNDEHHRNDPNKNANPDALRV